jgi:hypothetical protein
VRAERDADESGPAKEWMGKCTTLRLELDAAVQVHRSPKL